MSLSSHRDEAIVALRLLPGVALCCLDRANQTRRHHGADERGLVHENEHIDWIAIVALRTWDEAEVLKLVRTYHISVVCLFPTLFDPEAPVNAHRILYRQLAHGNIPDWLVPTVDTPLVKVYEVRLR